MILRASVGLVGFVWLYLKQLTDGTSYADAIVLNITAEKLTVHVDNSGYKKASN